VWMPKCNSLFWKIPRVCQGEIQLENRDGNFYIESCQRSMYDIAISLSAIEMEFKLARCFVSFPSTHMDFCRVYHIVRCGYLWG
jgi:hypothetical protein